MTLAEAKNAALAAGIPEAEITPQDLVAYGFDPQGALATYTAPTAQRTDEQVQADVGLVAAAIKEGAVSPYLITALNTVLGLAVKLL